MKRELIEVKTNSENKLKTALKLENERGNSYLINTTDFNAEKLTERIISLEYQLSSNATIQADLQEAREQIKRLKVQNDKKKNVSSHNLNCMSP